MRYFSLVLLLTATTARADVVLDWNNTALAAIRRTSSPPPVAARALAMTHVAIQDAINTVERTHRPLVVRASERPAASWRAAAAQAAHGVLTQAFPMERELFDEALADSLREVAEGTAKADGIALGRLVADQVVAWRENDGSERSATYEPGATPGQWRPTPPGFRPALLPQWALVRPFAITDVASFRPAFPPSLRSAEYARDWQEVKDLGAADSALRTAGQTEIAHFWADGAGTDTPPGHWNRIAQTVSRSSRLTPAENARLFALLNLALADAAIVCWDMKFACNLWRPVTAIREADTDENERTDPDPDWTPLLETPPFPSCTSGHSTFSGAAAEMLALFFGRDELGFADDAGGAHDPRVFVSFSQAAAEAGRSRIYGGIHYEFDNQAGLASGRAISRAIFERHLRPLGTTHTVARHEVLRPTERTADASVWRPATTVTYRVSDPQSSVVPVTTYYLDTGTQVCQPLGEAAAPLLVPQAEWCYSFESGW
jgi:hypothetical protein